MQNVTKDYPPTLLLHGDGGTDVSYELSVLMAEELSRHDVEHELISMEGRGHGFDGKMDDPIVAGAFEWVLDFYSSVSP